MPRLRAGISCGRGRGVLGETARADQDAVTIQCEYEAEYWRPEVMGELRKVYWYGVLACLPNPGLRSFDVRVERDVKLRSEDLAIADTCTSTYTLHDTIQ